ncbi:MAG: metal-sulfur cluster assembly factor [Cytophagaceae bacterium]|nr:metal-sulfur cluster assembly factor [Gemmatimonadaceae bacterium]
MYEDDQPLPRPAHAAGESGEPSTDAAVEGDVASEGGPLTADRVKVALRRVKDPEINMNIVDLGLIYDVVVEGNDVRVDMSLTSPGCPSGPEIMGDAQRQVETIEGIGTATINLVWSPPWTPDRIEPRVRAYLGF